MKAHENEKVLKYFSLENLKQINYFIVISILTSHVVRNNVVIA
jgi:hypothetical protein